MTLDEKWEIVRAYYELVYKSPEGIKIKFHTRISDKDIEMLYQKMNLLSKEIEDIKNPRKNNFSNVVQLVRSSDAGNIK